MKILEKFFDPYSFKARLVPAIFFVILLNGIYVLYYRRVIALPLDEAQISLQAVVSIGIVFLLSSTIRGVGKYLVEDIMYGGRVDMPTTKILLNPSESKLSKAKVEEIYKYIFDDLNVDLGERKKLLEGQKTEAKKEISELVSKIRDKTRSDGFLFRYNVQYGMFRNTTGALLLIVLASIATLIIDGLFFEWQNMDITLSLLSGAVLLFIVSIYLTRKTANDYAERLFDAFMLVVDKNASSQ